MPATTRAAIRATERAIKRVGCRVVERRTLAMSGEPYWRLSCPSHKAKVQLLDALAWIDARYLPSVQELAAELARGCRTQTDVALVIHAYVKSAVVYVPERIETFIGSGMVTLTGGDCDDSSRLALALLRAAGLRARPKTLWEPPRHVAAQVHLGDRWHWLEASVDAHPGEHPLVARDRLRLP